jgi:hypothetical protein
MSIFWLDGRKNKLYLKPAGDNEGFVRQLPKEIWSFI